MNPGNKKNRFLVFIFLLGIVLFNYPVLSLFNLNIMVSGVPLLYLYLFFVWGLIIGLIAMAARLYDSKDHR